MHWRPEKTLAAIPDNRNIWAPDQVGCKGSLLGKAALAADLTGTRNLNLVRSFDALAARKKK